MLWFAWKFVPLWYQQQLLLAAFVSVLRCDLLENSYLCGISNNTREKCVRKAHVVICLKIRTFVVSATTCDDDTHGTALLWFAWKFVPLWYQQQHAFIKGTLNTSCDLLENSYLCGISNNRSQRNLTSSEVVICLKIRTFVVSATTYTLIDEAAKCCDLLENSYLCGISNNEYRSDKDGNPLWFAWKFVPLWYQQQRTYILTWYEGSCDLLENSYLCGISNNLVANECLERWVVICLKIRTFVVSATTNLQATHTLDRLWFAWKFVPLWYQQQLRLFNQKAVKSCDLLENSYLCGISNNRLDCC